MPWLAMGVGSAYSCGMFEHILMSYCPVFAVLLAQLLTNHSHYRPEKSI